MKNKKNNNIGYKIVSLLIGLFVLATVLMAWIGGLSTIPKKTVKASADTVNSVVGRVALAPFVGTFLGDNTPLISSSTIYFNYDFTAQDYYFTVYDNNVLSSTLTSGSITSGLSYLTFKVTGNYNSNMSFTTSVIVDPLPTFTVINRVYLQYGADYDSFIFYVEGYDGSTTTTGIPHVVSLTFEFTIMPPFSIPSSYAGKMYGYIMPNLSNTNNTSINTQAIYDNGYKVGYNEGTIDGRAEGEQIGYNKATAELGDGLGFRDLFNGVFFAPFHFLYSLLNVDLLGVNIFNLFTAIITIGLLSFIVRLFI